MRQRRGSSSPGSIPIPRKRKKKSPKTTLPALPSQVHNILGPIPIQYVRDLRTNSDEKALGMWCPEERVIQIRDGIAPEVAWLTIKHEWVHAVLWHAGVKLTEETEERI